MSCKSRSRSRSPILDYKAASCSHINTRSRGTVDDRTRFDKSSNLIQSHSKQDQPSGAEDQERISAFDINDEFDPSPPNFSISSGPSSCENQSQSKQLDKEKIWKLKNADMRILDFSTIKGQEDKGMFIKMEFSFPNGITKKVDLPYTVQSLANSRNKVITKCEKYVYLDGCLTYNQDKYFGTFIEQMLKKFTEENDSSQTRKPLLEVNKPSVHRISFESPGLETIYKFYFISSDEDVYLLNSERNEDKPYTQKLTADEIGKLPVEVIYIGPKAPTYKTDEKDAIKLLLEIIKNMNLMQDPEFYSFPLASFVAHLSGHLYTILVEAHRCFSTSIVLSGDGNTCRVGKSLMTSTNQKIFLGHYPDEQQIKVTEATLFNELHSGNILYLKEWAKHANIVNLAVPMVWERLGRRVGDKFQHVNSVILVEANLSPSSVKLTGGNESKVSFIATGSKPLSHPAKLELANSMVALAELLHLYLPVLFGLGLHCMLKRITTQELIEYDGILNEDRDERQAQTFLNYDRVYNALLSCILRHSLESPPLFQYKYGIDRRALTFFNEREQLEHPEEMAKVLAEYIVQQDPMELSNSIEFSEKSNVFRLKLSMNVIPKEVAKALRMCCRETSSVFKGKRGVKVRLLSPDLLTEEHVMQLKSAVVNEDYDQWVDASMDKVDEIMDNLGTLFYELYGNQDQEVNEAESSNRTETISLLNGTSTSELITEPESREKENSKTQGKENKKPLCCTIPGCPSFKSQFVFKSDAVYERHLGTKMHLKAVADQEHMVV